MTDYLAPGVYVAEIPDDRRILPQPLRPAAFIGPTASGPIEKPSRPLASVTAFTEVFGHDRSVGLGRYIEGYFNNGGSALRVVRVDETPESRVDAYRRAIGALAASESALLAAPALHEHVSPDEAARAAQALIDAAEASKGFALIDPPRGMSPSGVREFRRRFASSFAALYYPWVRETSSSRVLAPSGVLAGVYARIDASKGVHKAPANAALHGIDGFELEINQAHQESLNPEGINCLRTFAGRGPRVWGARTLAADPEWKYVNVRRYFNFLEESIETGTRWSVFEPNGPALWRLMEQVVGGFLHEEWRRRALQGSSPNEAYFVRCDRTTMTQDDLDSGRLVAVIGVAPIKPAEFVIFRIGQWAALA